MDRGLAFVPCYRCGKSVPTDQVASIHTCTPPAIVRELEAKLAQVTAERDQANSELDKVRSTALAVMRQRDDERHRSDMAEAQVAVLVEVLRSAVGYIRIQRSEDPAVPTTAGHAIHMRDGDRLIELANSLLANLPAAAEKLLAAQRVAEVADSRERIGWRDHALACKCNDPECQRMRFALEAWRNAGQ